MRADGRLVDTGARVLLHLIRSQNRGGVLLSLLLVFSFSIRVELGVLAIIDMDSIVPVCCDLEKRRGSGTIVCQNHGSGTGR
jgi:hypothetical protein